MTQASVEVNGRSYNWPDQPVVVICCDGSEPAYMEDAANRGIMPKLQKILGKGEDLRGLSVVPSFTNPNNLSIVTGRPPAVHGISGNFFFDPETGQEVLMNDPKFLRAPTIFEGFQKAGAKVVVITAKDKLRLLLGNGLTFGDSGSICFSSERADECTLEGNGIDRRMRDWSAWTCRRFTRRIVVGIRFRRRRETAGTRQTRPHVSVDHRLCAA